MNHCILKPCLTCTYINVPSMGNEKRKECAATNCMKYDCSARLHDSQRLPPFKRRYRASISICYCESLPFLFVVQARRFWQPGRYLRLDLCNLRQKQQAHFYDQQSEIDILGSRCWIMRVGHLQYSILQDYSKCLSPLALFCLTLPQARLHNCMRQKMLSHQQC